jgi:hypothetical protein
MADETLLKRVRKSLSRRRGITEKRMFGGHCFFANGNMLGGVTRQCELIVRVGPDAYQQALQSEDARKMDFTGRPMRGFVVITTSGVASDADLRRWIDFGVAFARSLPPKIEKKR